VENLFGELDIEDAPAAPMPEGPFAAVALEQGIDRLLDYSIPKRLIDLLHVGQLVKVPLGRKNRTTKGYVVSINATTTYPKIKPVAGIEDERVLVPPKLMELARWMSRYYVTPLGVVLDSVIPAAVKKQIGVGYLKMVRLAKPREAIQEILEKTKAPKRRATLARLLLLEENQSIELVKLASEAGTKSATVRKLAKSGLITITSQVDFPRLTAGVRDGAGVEADIELNEEQKKVLEALLPKLSRGGEARASGSSSADAERALALPSPGVTGEGKEAAGGAAGFSVSLLHGVTGSGKTEVYLQCIRKVVEGGRQAIVLVPEIALTPQTVRRFTARFKRVAILHSGLTSSERHRYWQQISTGMADVVVGARSAIFAPVPELGIIVVDEEHEASYKQDTAPRYQGRDVAIKRGQIEGVPVILGSATPSLESYGKAAREGESSVQYKKALTLPSPGVPGEGKTSAAPTWQLLTMPSRVRGLALPHIELIDMKIANRYRRGVHLISERLEHLLRATVESKKQAILLLNRRGYSNFVYCVSCGNVVSCKYCDKTMTYHRAAGTHAKNASAAEGVHTGTLHCHYCLAVNPLPANCPVCQKKLSLFGLGTQRVEEEIQRKFPELRYSRVDSDSMRSSKDYEETLKRFGNNEIQVLLGTQMIAKGLDYPNVTLVGVVSGDTALALPDFRASERTFQLITQVAGRAGRGDAPGRVVLQTFMPEDPTIQAAIKQDYVRFANNELKNRREVGLPPFARMVRIVLRDEDQEKLFKLAEELGAALSEEAAKEGDAVKLKGPMPCAINRIAGYHRNQIVMFAAEASRLQRILAAAREKGALSKTDRIAVDVDPTSLL
jgi:primosomal protein N' (replication factor Y)